MMDPGRFFLEKDSQSNFIQNYKSSYFITSLSKYLQTLCSSFVSFERYVLVTGNLSVTIDTGEDLNYVVNEKLCKSNEHGINFLSNSFYSPKEKYENSQRQELVFNNNQRDAGDLSSEACYAININNSDLKELNIKEFKSDNSEKDSLPLSFPNNFDSSDDTVDVDCENLEEELVIIKNKTSTEFKSEEFLDQSPIKEEQSTSYQQYDDTINGVLNHSKEDSSTPSLSHEEKEIILQTKKTYMNVFTAKKNKKAKKSAVEENRKDSSTMELKKPNKKKRTTDNKCYCDVCGKTYSSPSSLAYHKKAHSGEKPFACTFCPKTFLYKQGLDQHIIIHTGEKPFKCDLCGFKCNRKSRLHAHKLNLHADVKPARPVKNYVCEICAAVYHEPSSLRYHKLTHSTDKAHQCDICKKSFRTKAVLKRHAIVHTGEKRFTCELCGKAFGHKTHLNKHKFLHTGEKPHVCDICGQGFAQRDTLVSHKRRHTGERPFVCNNCGQKFTQSGALSVHKRKCNVPAPTIDQVSNMLYGQPFKFEQSYPQSYEQPAAYDNGFNQRF